MNPRYSRVAERAAHCCEYCQAPEAIFNCAINLLRMNSATQVTARLHWLRLKLFPKT